MPASTDNKTIKVSWRLPARIAEANPGDWSAMRDHLEAWRTSGELLDLDPPEDTQTCSLRVPAPILQALEAEAKRLTKLLGKRYTAGSVAKLVWDTWHRADEPETGFVCSGPMGGPGAGPRRKIER